MDFEAGDKAMPAAVRVANPAVLPQDEQETAREASRAVARLAGHGAVRVEAVPVSDHEPAQTFVLPAGAVKMLCEMLAHLGSGKPVSVIPNNAEFTTGEAADFLNVSRPWIVQLIERGELPCHMVGTHRRILYADLRAYKEQTRKAQLQALDELAAEAQALGEYT
jgi:excisionase family DNA binding protein